MTQTKSQLRCDREALSYRTCDLKTLLTNEAKLDLTDDLMTLSHWQKH